MIQNGFGRRLWEVGNVRNELVRGEAGWSTFAEREVKCIVDWSLRIVYEEINEREQQYVHMKSQPKNEKYANGSVGARLMVRGGCLPVRGSN